MRAASILGDGFVQVQQRSCDEGPSGAFGGVAIAQSGEGSGVEFFGGEAVALSFEEAAQQCDFFIGWRSREAAAEEVGESCVVAAGL